MSGSKLEDKNRCLENVKVAAAPYGITLLDWIDIGFSSPVFSVIDNKDGSSNT